MLIYSTAGTEYGATDVFDLNSMEPYGVTKLYEDYTAYSRDVVLYLPRTSDLNELALYAKRHQHSPEKRLQVAHYCMRGASKAMCAFLGDFEFT